VRLSLDRLYSSHQEVYGIGKKTKITNQGDRPNRFKIRIHAAASTKKLDTQIISTKMIVLDIGYSSLCTYCSKLKLVFSLGIRSCSKFQLMICLPVNRLSGHKAPRLSQFSSEKRLEITRGTVYQGDSLPAL
jgi:hypothetical protein